MRFKVIRQSALAAMMILAAPVAVLGGEFAGFEEPAIYPVDLAPWSIRAGDIDGDGDIDLITANRLVTSSNLSLLFNHGDGAFAEAVNIPIANGTTDVAIVDFDRDGVIDLAVSFAGVTPLGGGPIGGLALLKGLGDGEFGEPQFFNAGVQPVSIDAGDFNGDGAPDLILANQLSHNVAVFLNTGDGTFAMPEFYPVGSWPQRVALVDMDQDGDTDAIAMNRFSNDLSVLYNNGKGVFILRMTVPTPNTVNTSLSIMDVTGDSFAEVLVPTSGQETISLHENVNGVLKSEPIVIDVGFSVPVADFARLDKGDEVDITAGGREDAPDPTSEPALQQSFLGDGVNEFDPVNPLLFGVLGHAPSAQCVADLDGDGDIDVAAAFGNEVSVLLNKTNTPNTVDLTGDGFVNTPDLVLLLNAWGNPGAADFDKSGAVDGRDLAHLLSNWTAPAQGAPVSYPKKGASR